MEIVLGVALLVVVIWIATRRRKSAQRDPSTTAGAAARSAGGSAAPKQPGTSHVRSEIERAVARDYGAAAVDGELRKVQRRSTKDHVPPAPTGSAVEAWSPRTQQLEVAGEWYRAENLRSLFTKHATVSESGDELRLPAVLVPDPSNPYDKHAVAVFVEDLHVGYMERPDARAYHKVIAGSAGGELTAPSRQWLRGTDRDTWARVTLSLPNPADLRCPNPTTGGQVILPPGSTVQVTKEEEHMEHLATLLTRYGTETIVAATLRSVIEHRPRSTVELVGVEIDGQPVGVLSTTQTANFLSLVRKAEAAGVALTCRASLRGNALKADVALHARKAHELTDQELQALFAAV